MKTKFRIGKVKTITKELDFIVIKLDSLSQPNAGIGADLVASYNDKTGDVSTIQWLNPTNYKTKKEVRMEELFTSIIKFKEKLDLLAEEDLEFVGYDKTKDIYHFSFDQQMKKGNGVDLGHGVILRINPKTKEWLGVSIQKH